MDVLTKKVIFIDRDGTIGGGDQVDYPGQFQLFPQVKESISKLKQAGKFICAFTNQPGISRGEAQKEDFLNELSLFGFNEVYICPHQHGEGCNCRKPSAGMLHQAAKELNLDLTKCIVIGDRWTDMMAAQEAGCIKILVKTGSGKNDLVKYENNEYYGKWLEVSLDYIAEDFNDAVTWILK
ncbi:HAD-IIIA family hydrolase [Paenibacillus lautus]|uniref:HAD-IIIA family hydrolase n=1 Tax=Paenibacillus lautus TaxID=1401 RepID=UPI000FDBC94C|nr:HAD-IIIA family hydrolase [Paenibacillus lautus]